MHVFMVFNSRLRNFIIEDFLDKKYNKNHVAGKCRPCIKVTGYAFKPSGGRDFYA